MIGLKYQPGLTWSDLIEKKQVQKQLKEKRINEEIEKTKKVHDFILQKQYQSEQRDKHIKKH